METNEVIFVHYSSEEETTKIFEGEIPEKKEKKAIKRQIELTEFFPSLKKKKSGTLIQQKLQFKKLDSLTISPTSIPPLEDFPLIENMIDLTVDPFFPRDAWDEDNVKLPCSPQNLFDAKHITTGQSRSKWSEIKNILETKISSLSELKVGKFISISFRISTGSHINLESEVKISN
jgi:hypothetical protein